MFVLGGPHLILAIDHKPLVLLFNDSSLNEIKNPRILDIRDQILMYKFKAISLPGDANGRENEMSHIPVPTDKLTAVESTNLEETIKAGIHYQYDQETSPINLACIKREANIDYQYQSLLETIEQSFLKCKELLPIHLREFWNI